MAKQRYAVPGTASEAWAILQRVRDGEVMENWLVSHAVVAALLDLNERAK